MTDSPRAIPGAPPLDEPVPRDPVAGVSMEAYAQIAARLAAKRPRAEVLTQARLDERRWLQVEKTWLLRIAIAALRKELDLIEQYDAAFQAETRALRPT